MRIINGKKKDSNIIKTVNGKSYNVYINGRKRMPSSGPLYTYTMTNVDTLEFVNADCSYFSVALVTTGVFAIAFMDGGVNGGKIDTFSYDVAGDTITAVDTLTHNAGIVTGPNSLVAIDATHLMIAYSGAAFDGFIRSLTYSTPYSVLATTNTLEHDTDDGQECSLCQLDTTHFALAYKGTTDHPQLKTFSIDGLLAITQISAIEVEANACASYGLIKFDATHVFLISIGAGANGFVRTFSFDVNFDNLTETDNLDMGFDASDVSAVLLDATHVAVAYRKTLNKGCVAVYAIDGTYQITLVDELEHVSASCTLNSIVRIDDTHFAVGFYQTGGTVNVKTFAFLLDTVTELNALVADTGVEGGGSFERLSETLYAFAYQGAEYDGFVKTFRLT